MESDDDYFIGVSIAQNWQEFNLNVLDFKFHLNWSQSKGLGGIVLMTFMTMKAKYIERFWWNREVICVIVCML